MPDADVSSPARHGPLSVARLSDPASARQLFFVVLCVTFAVRALIAWRLPITGDEAYFYFWGKVPDWGFYDHPPMVGWWIAALRLIADAPFVIRLPALLVPPAVAWLVRQALARHDPALGWQVATLVLLAPLNAWNVAITTDVPLMLFAALAMVLLLRAQRSERAGDYLLAGLALAGALMSKYFAGLLAIAIFAHAVWRPDRAKLRGLVLVALGALPAAVIQIAWNSQNCWPNLMFNLVNRHDNAGWSLRTPPLYLVSLMYVLIPYVAWRLARLRRQRPSAGSLGGAGTEDAARTPAAATLAFLAGVPFALFALLSAIKTIGLHWLASFVAPALMLFGLRSDRAAIGRALQFGLGFAALHYLAIAIAASLPLESYRGLRAYDGMVLTLAPQDIERAIAPYRKGADGQPVALAAEGYSPAVTLGFDLGEYVFVFGPGSSHARHDDILTDVRKLDGRDVLVIRKGPPALDEHAPYFERIEVVPLEVRGARFWLVRGFGFKYSAYRDTVLEEVRRRWYQVPTWLPKGPCYFCDRYFPERACHR